MSLFEELKRRNVVKTAVLYVVASWLTLQVADVLFDALELPSAWVRLVLAILILGLPIALIFSWIFEMTPDGLKRERDVDRSQSITPQTGRKINVLIVAMLVLAIAAVVVDRLIPETTPVADVAIVDEGGASEAVDPTALVAEKLAPDRSVAVLPFANRSAREEDVFFVDGIHDDILTQLARIGSLTVISRTSVEKFRDTSESMKEIGAALGVKTILEGGVQRAGDRVRISVQLIDVTTDDHLWADTYDRELTTANIFAIQSEISTAIAEALRATLSLEEKAQLDSVQTENLAALEAYFLGRQAMAMRTSASLATAARHFKSAIALDPDYALAYVGLANTYDLQAGYGSLPELDQKALSRQLIDRALAINDQLGEAYVAMARDSEDPGTAEALYRKSIELAPGYVSGHHWYGTFLTWQGRPAEGLIRLEEAARLDPLSGIVRSSLGATLEALGRFEEAREVYESTLRIDPDFAVVYRDLADMDYFVRGRLDEAIVSLRQAAALDPGSPTYHGYLAALWSELGDETEADRALARVRAFNPDIFWSRFAALLIRLNRGQAAEAVADAEAIFAGNPFQRHALWVLSLNDLRLDRVDVALARFRAVYPELSDDADPIIRRRNFDAAIRVAFLLQAAGEHKQAELLLDRNMAFIQTIPRSGLDGFQISDVMIDAMKGRSDAALAALRQAVDDGWRIGWRSALEYGPILASLRDEPEFQTIVAELEADMAAQLEHLRELDTTGELPPIPE